MNKTDVQHEIRKIIEDDLNWPVAIGELGPQTVLGSQGLRLDSIMLIEFGIRLEQRFGVPMSDDDILALGEQTIEEVSTAVILRLAGSSAADQEPQKDRRRVFLGIASGHTDPAAAIVEDGRVIAYAEEERFSRNKHAVGTYPMQALRHCLAQANVSLQDVEAVAVGWNAEAYGDGTMENFFSGLRRDWSPDPATIGWQDACLRRLSPSGMREHHHREWRRAFGRVELPPFAFIPHHYTHAFQAAFESSWERVVVLTADGSGDEHTTVLWLRDGDRLEPLREIRMPHSLGWFYAAFTEYLGFDAYDGEYKVMGLAAYGRLDEQLTQTVGKVLFAADDGVEFRLDPQYIHYGEHTYSGRFTDALVDLFGVQPRLHSEPIDQWHRDLALAVQTALEEAVCRLVSWAAESTGVRNLAVGGGVALNVKMNARLRELPGIDAVAAHPLAADSGAAAGAALAACFRATGSRPATLASAALGPDVSGRAAAATLRESLIEFEAPEDLFKTVAQDLADGRIVGWVDGRAEAGPRALGQRSILADPRTIAQRDRVNAAVKRRESWRPFGPSMLAEATERYLGAPVDSRFMTMAYEATEALRDDAPAVVHTDGTTRVQTVHAAELPRYHALITAFAEITGIPVLLNTSLNVRGEPMVLSVEDALRTFWSTGLDVLVVGDLVVRKAGCAGEARS